MRFSLGLLLQNILLSANRFQKNSLATARSTTLLLGVGFAALLSGAILGLGAFTFIYAKGYSYLTNNPEACANCHIMQEHFNGWSRSSHHAVAVCNDCHTPPDFFGKYVTKALNGYHHSLAFTLGGYHEPLMITDRNRAITEESCGNCHEAVLRYIDPHHSSARRLSCVHCHKSVGHLR